MPHYLGSLSVMIPLCRSASALLALVVLVRGTTAAAQTLPSGWRIVAGPGAGMERAYEASGLPAGQYLTIEQGPLQPRAGAAIDAWLTAAVTADLAPEGTWGPQPRPTNVTGDLMATVAREFQATSNRRGGRIYLGVSGGAGEAARVIRLTFSSAEALKSAQGATARELMSELARQSITAQRSGGGGVAGRAPAAEAGPSPALPRSRAGFSAGGPIVPGRYTGTMVNDDGKVIVRYDVTLFANGEYAAASGDNLLDSTGTYEYTPATGRLDVDGKLWNSRYEPEEDFCLYGRDASGNPAIYVEDYYGIGTFRALLRRVSAPARDLPTVVRAARNAAQAEAERYKFVTAPGAGVQPSQIEAVYYEWKQEYEIGGLQFKEQLYLLLADGTVHEGLPVPPQDLDVAASRRNEPEAWGRWRKVGTTYQFAMAGARQFEGKQGYVVQPARSGLALSGRFEGSSSYQIPGGAGAWSKFGVTFSPGQRFERFRSGGAGMTSGYGNTSISTTAVYDDDGSVGGAVGATAAGGSSRRIPDTGNRRGTYRTDGYALILTYQNGTVQRLPFVVEEKVPGRVGGVWMEGYLLTPPTK